MPASGCPTVHLDRQQRQRLRVRRRGDRQPVRDRARSMNAGSGIALRQHDRPATSSAGSSIGASRRATPASSTPRSSRSRRTATGGCGGTQRAASSASGSSTDGGAHWTLHGRLGRRHPCGLRRRRGRRLSAELVRPGGRGGPDQPRPRLRQTPSTSGSRRAPGRPSATRPAATAARARSRSTWTSTRSPSCPAPPASCCSGNDGGVHGTTNANLACRHASPTWFNMDTGLNTIEFYSGDISGNFATSPTPSGQRRRAGQRSQLGPLHGQPDGARRSGRWDWAATASTPASTRSARERACATSEGNNSGGISRCVSNCTVAGAGWTSRDRRLDRRHAVVHPAVGPLPRRDPGRRRLRGGRRRRAAAAI